MGKTFPCISREITETEIQLQGGPAVAKNKKMKHGKEIGLPPNASEKAKRMDEKADTKAHIVEGSKADLKKDKEIMKKYGRKGK